MDIGIYFPPKGAIAWNFIQILYHRDTWQWAVFSNIRVVAFNIHRFFRFVSGTDSCGRCIADHGRQFRVRAYKRTNIKASGPSILVNNLMCIANCWSVQCLKAFENFFV